MMYMACEFKKMCMKLTNFDKNKGVLKIEQSSVKILCVRLKNP